MTKKFLAANWKMNPPPEGWEKPDSPFRTHADCDVVVFPTFLDLERCSKAGLIVGAQCGRSTHHGAFTGDVSIDLLKHTPCRYVLCGHSDRRNYHGETDEEIATQVVAALEANIHPILCIGETEEERAKKKTEHVLKKQLSSLSTMNSHLSLTIAYEPVWAIGNGKTATAAQAQEAHAFIRSQLDVRILYGGSVKPENAAELIAMPDIDGLLIGQSSLDVRAFRGIVDACTSS